MSAHNSVQCFASQQETECDSDGGFMTTCKRLVSCNHLPCHFIFFSTALHDSRFFVQFAFHGRSDWQEQVETFYIRDKEFSRSLSAGCGHYRKDVVPESHHGRPKTES